MKFLSMEASVKKQIKPSMKRIAQKLIKLNAERTNRLDYITVFSVWTNRYISNSYGTKYYNLMTVDEELFEDFRSLMEGIFLKEIAKPFGNNQALNTNHPKYYIEKPATEKQIYYAKYLMDTVKNEPLPDKKYTMHEISLLINDLKSKLQTI
jgi:hypothetical protein